MATIHYGRFLKRQIGCSQNTVDPIGGKDVAVGRCYPEARLAIFDITLQLTATKTTQKALFRCSKDSLRDSKQVHLNLMQKL